MPDKAKYEVAYTDHTTQEVEAESIDYVDHAGGWVVLTDAFGTVFSVKAADVKHVKRLD